MRTINRRSFLRAGTAAAGGMAAFGILTRRGDAAEFSWRYANNNVAQHPMNVRLREAVDLIREQSGGRVDIQVFPNSQLGGDTDMLSQLRTGAIQLFNLSGLILSTFVPLASINGIGFAFKDYDQVWGAMDGALGAFIRAAIAKSGLYAFASMWDNGYRQITSSTHPINAPDDLDGLQDPRAGEPALDLDVQGVRRRAGQHQHQRSLFGACRPGSSRARRTRWR